MNNILHNNRGLSLIELVVTMVILSVLASLIIPSAQITSKRVKEIELKRNLREIRSAIDEYKKYYDKAIDEKKLPAVVDDSGYPKTLEVLVEGYDFGGLTKHKKKFLRRVPTDPLHRVKDAEELPWGMRSHNDDTDSASWGEEDVFDVYSKSDGTAIDGTKYKDW